LDAKTFFLDAKDAEKRKVREELSLCVPLRLPGVLCVLFRPFVVFLIICNRRGLSGSRTLSGWRSRPRCVGYFDFSFKEMTLTVRYFPFSKPALTTLKDDDVREGKRPLTQRDYSEKF
jgi:hypothetical protein